MPSDPTIRPRRLRLNLLLRNMLQRVTLRRSDIIVPIFVREGKGEKRAIASMPGVNQMSIDVATDFLAARTSEGFAAYLVFGVIDRAKKDAHGSAALDPDNVVCKLLRKTTEQKIPMVPITDLCFCEYTS